MTFVDWMCVVPSIVGWIALNFLFQRCVRDDHMVYIKIQLVRLTQSDLKIKPHSVSDQNERFVGLLPVIRHQNK